ncbi:hypothetical protein [Natrinema thermotolerans]|uniref:hypothetical protein n=1 Tax=Natrinema thermotolerans TaxID=121872 RepID=UPI000678EC55|nr:hypothetical protein [Natrinema thermotolerans]QCC57225.1 hypothetical protein DVR14_00700 [Natrinema thermotolerans]
MPPRSLADDRIVIQALLEYSLERRDYDPGRADRAYRLAADRAARNGLGLGEIVRRTDGEK